RAAGVREQHPVPLTGQHLEFWKQHVAIVGVRPAVNREHEWIGLPRLVSEGLHQPPFDLQAADAGEPERVGRNERDLLEERIIEGGQPPLAAAGWSEWRH